MPARWSTLNPKARWPERDLAGNAIDFGLKVLKLSFQDTMREITRR